MPADYKHLKPLVHSNHTIVMPRLEWELYRDTPKGRSGVRYWVIRDNVVFNVQLI